MVETLKIANNPSTAINQNKINRPTTLLDLNESKNNDDVNKPDKKDDATKKNDRVELSQEAQDILFQQNVIPLRSEGVDKARRELQDNALEFRGIFETSKRRDLTDVEEQRLSTLRDNINNAFEGRKEVSADEVLKIANKTLSDFQAEASDILGRLSGGTVTNTDFARLDKINRDLNKANGFGGEALRGQQKALDELNKAQESILNLPEKRRLTEAETKILEQVQTQISSLEGYRINVKQSIGVDGVRV